MREAMSPRSAEQFEKMRTDSKEKIAETAMRLFAQKGYGATTIETIAAQSGVAKGLVYNYFDNKEELLLYTFMSAFEHIEASFSSLLPVTDPVVAIESFINGMFDFLKEHTDFWRLQMNIMMQPSVPPRLREAVMKKLHEYIAMFSAMFMQSGIENATGEAWLFAASMDGVMLYYLLNEQVCPLDEIRTVLLKKYSTLLKSTTTGGGKK
jgi:AcrR family transcriptional regulator